MCFADEVTRNLFVYRLFSSLCLVMVVQTEDAAGEGQQFAKGGKDGGVDVSCGWHDERGGYHQRTKDDHCKCQIDLMVLHRKLGS